MKTQGFFFDLYGTLLVYGDMNQAWADWLETFYNRLNARGVSISRASFSRRCDGFFSAAPPASVDGQLTVLERRIQRLCTQLGHRIDTGELRSIADGIAAAWQTHISIDPEALPVLRNLKQHKKTIGLVSNFDHPPHVRRILSENGWATIFDTVIISSEVGLKKPDPAIFALALQQVKVRQNDAVYIGDTHDDVDGAIAAGIHPIFIARAGNPTDNRALDFQIANHQNLPQNGFSASEVTVIKRLREILDLA
jgi:putative hydrolase of the HAD superfamily